jgi:hypothetical protein
MSEATETLAELLLQAIRAELLDVHTCLPAKIQTYDSATQKADVIPLLKKKYRFDDEPKDLPIITNVPVQQPSGNSGAAYMYIPVVAGDIGWVIFAERSIDTWLAGEGDSVAPRDPRHHHLSDAIFMPGGLPFKKALSIANPDNMTLKNSSMSIEIDPSGKIKIQGATQELLAVIDSFMGNVISANVLVGSGSSAGPWPLDPATIAALTIDQTNLQTLKI